MSKTPSDKPLPTALPKDVIESMQFRGKRVDTKNPVMNLSLARKRMLYRYLEANSYENTVKWCKDTWGLSFSHSQLSRFWHEVNSQAMLERKLQIAKLVELTWIKENQGVDMEQIADAALTMQLAQLVDGADVKDTVALIRATNDRMKLLEERRKVDLRIKEFEEKQKKLRKVAEDSDLTPEESDARYREILGMPPRDAKKGGGA